MDDVDSREQDALLHLRMAALAVRGVPDGAMMEARLGYVADQLLARLSSKGYTPMPLDQPPWMQDIGF